MKKLLWALVIALLAWNSWLTYKVYFVPEEAPADETQETSEPGTTVVYNTVTGYTTDITGIVEKTRPATVIVTSRDEYETPATGSGVIYRSNDRDCYIVTSASLIPENPAEIRVHFDNSIALDAELIGQDQQTDIAILLTHPEFDTDPIALGDSDLIRQGEYAVSMSGRNPLTGNGTVTFGVVSEPMQQLRPAVDEEHSEAVINILMADLALPDPGVGGPLLNLSGEMIGIMSRRLGTSEGSYRLTAAAAVSEVRTVADRLIAEGSVSRKYLGIIGRDIEDMQVYEKSGANLQLDVTSGIVITRIIEESPAAASELLVGDVLTAVNDTEIHNLRDLRNFLYTYEPEEEQETTVTVNRSGSVITFQVFPR